MQVWFEKESEQGNNVRHGQDGQHGRPLLRPRVWRRREASPPVSLPCSIGTRSLWSLWMNVKLMRNSFLMSFKSDFRLESKAEKLHKEANGYSKSLRGEWLDHRRLSPPLSTSFCTGFCSCEEHWQEKGDNILHPPLACSLNTSSSLPLLPRLLLYPPQLVVPSLPCVMTKS